MMNISTQVRVHFLFFYDGGPYHIEDSPLICRTNQWAGFCMIGTSVMKEVIYQEL